VPNEPVPDSEEVPTDNEEQPANESEARAAALAEAGPPQNIGDIPPPPPGPPTPVHVAEPVQTDNRPRDEDGVQDVNQEPEPAEGSV
jgi:hypothetical protein